MLMILECDCHEQGAEKVPCAMDDGQCTCKPNVHGLNCHECKPTYWNFPNCECMY